MLNNTMTQNYFYMPLLYIMHIKKVLIKSYIFHIAESHLESDTETGKKTYPC